MYPISAHCRNCRKALTPNLHGDRLPCGECGSLEACSRATPCSACAPKPTPLPILIITATRELAEAIREGHTTSRLARLREELENALRENLDADELEVLKQAIEEVRTKP